MQAGCKVKHTEIQVSQCKTGQMKKRSKDKSFELTAFFSLGRYQCQLILFCAEMKVCLNCFENNMYPKLSETRQFLLLQYLLQYIGLIQSATAGSGVVECCVNPIRCLQNEL